MSNKAKIKMIQVNLRIRSDLHRRLNGAADRHGVSLNTEMNDRLTRSLGRDDLREIDMIATDQAMAWNRFGERLLAREVESDLLLALEKRDFETARQLAIAIRRNQEAAAKERTQRMERMERE
jgi:hypothetical protein